MRASVGGRRPIRSWCCFLALLCWFDSSDHHTESPNAWPTVLLVHLPLHATRNATGAGTPTLKRGRSMHSSTRRRWLPCATWSGCWLGFNNTTHAGRFICSCAGVAVSVHTGASMGCERAIVFAVAVRAPEIMSSCHHLRNPF